MSTLTARLNRNVYLRMLKNPVVTIILKLNLKKRTKLSWKTLRFGVNTILEVPNMLGFLYMFVELHTFYVQVQSALGKLDIFSQFLAFDFSWCEYCLWLP